MKGKSSIVNLYIASSPLHYYCSCIIAHHFGNGEINHLLFTRAFLQDIVSAEGWDSVGFLPWPRFHPKKGLFGRIRRIRENLDLVADKCRGAETIRLHAPVIDTEAVNYHINHLRNHFPEAEFSVRLIPDGILNTRKHPLGRGKEVAQYLKKLRRVVYPEVSYYSFRGDRTGSEDSIVDMIYALPRLPHKYDPDKVMELPPFNNAGYKWTDDQRKGRAIVLSQPLASMGHMTKENMLDVRDGIREFLRSNEIRFIDYKRHPRDAISELIHPDYSVLKLKETLESHLMKNPYEIIIGISSTALITAKLFLGETCRVVSYGQDGIAWASDERRKHVESVLKGLDIEIVDHFEKPTNRNS